MGRLKIYWHVPLLFLLPVPCIASDLGLSLTERITALRYKSNAHNRFVTELIEKEFQPVDVARPLIPVQSSKGFDEDFLDEPTQVSPLPVVDLPTINDEPIIVEEIDTTPTEHEPKDDFEYSENNTDEGFSDSFSGNETYTSDGYQIPTYEEIYAPKVPQRRFGYYFGPFLALAFPDNSAITGGIDYQSQTGISTGIRLGKDFGTARLEGEYGFLTHKISSTSGSGKTGLHNLTTRLILERNLGEQADLRGGLGLGLGFANHELTGTDLSGLGFYYDFLLGWSYRIRDNWSFGFDYRYYLTAAHESYNRLQGHVLELSVCFDL